MDTTPDMLPNKSYVNVCNNSRKQTVVYLGSNLCEKILLDLLELKIFNFSEQHSEHLL